MKIRKKSGIAQNQEKSENNQENQEVLDSLYRCTYSKLFTCDSLPMSYIPNFNIPGIHPTTIYISRVFLSR